MVKALCRSLPRLQFDTGREKDFICFAIFFFFAHLAPTWQQRGNSGSIGSSSGRISKTHKLMLNTAPATYWVIFFTPLLNWISMTVHFWPCGGINDFFLFPSWEEKALSLHARFFCIVADEWDFHGVQGFLYLIAGHCADCTSTGD